MMNSKNIISISPWAFFWSMGKNKGMASDYKFLIGIAKRGWNVAHIAPMSKGLKYREDIEGIAITRINIPFYNYQYKNYILQYLFKNLSWLFLNLKYLNLIIKMFHCKSYDIIYCHTAVCAPAAFLAGKIYRIPVIVRLYGTFLYPCLGSWKKMFLNFQEVIGFKLPVTQLIIGNDGTKGDKVAIKLGIPRERIKFWRNGVDKHIYKKEFNTEKFRESLNINSENKVVLAVSRLVRWKRLDRLVKAIPNIVSQYSKAIFIIVGDGPERETLEKLAQELGVIDYIRFIGAVTHDKVVEFINAADIFVSVNDISNISNGLIEAMTCGKCIVALDTGDTSELIKQNKTGKLVKSENENMIPGELSKTILDVLKNEDLCLQISYNARTYAQNYFQTWDDRIEMEIQLLEELIAKNYFKNGLARKSFI